MIQLDSVSKYFGKTMVLNEVNALFEEGKTNLIIGQSGSGKTVLLKCIVGLHEISSGNIHYDERNFSGMSSQERKLIRQEMGMVFQGGALFDSMTVEQNIRFPLNMFTSKTREEKIERVNFCLDRVNLDKVNKLYPAEISGGMRKRVSIARAIALNPKYLFCDEPNSGLDPQTAIVIDNLIREITREYNMTTVINTHDMNSVMEIGEKVIFISEGAVIWTGNSEEILKADNKTLQDFVFASELMKKIRG
jgi:phospholipid/cholesterol/gamma-HCH transport system ATP-binding protein